MKVRGTRTTQLATMTSPTADPSSLTRALSTLLKSQAITSQNSPRISRECRRIQTKSERTHPSLTSKKTTSSRIRPSTALTPSQRAQASVTRSLSCLFTCKTRQLPVLRSFKTNRRGSMIIKTGQCSNHSSRHRTTTGISRSPLCRCKQWP